MSFLNEAPLQEPVHPQVPERHDVHFHDVSFSYDGQREVIKRMSFAAREGKVTAIVGASGSGKSTAIRLVSRFWDASQGQVTIGGVDVRQIASMELAKQVSCVFQDVFLFNDTIFENIRIGKPDATESDVIAAAKAASCHDFIMELPDGYGTQLDEHGDRLSGGQRQRISIARAILKDAPILLLVVAHRLGTIAQADQILVMHAGEVEAAGTHEELLGSSARYASMWEAFVAAEQGIAVERGHEQIRSADAPPNERTGGKSDEIRQELQPTMPEEANHFYSGLAGAGSYWRMLLHLAGPERGQLLKACLFPLLAAFLISLTTLSVVWTIHALSGSQIAAAWRYAGLLLLTLLGQVMLVIRSFQGFERYDNAVTRRMRVYLGQHLRRLPLGFFLSRERGHNPNTADG